jgi:hypothetical protein
LIILYAPILRDKRPDDLDVGVNPRIPRLGATHPRRHYPVEHPFDDEGSPGVPLTRISAPLRPSRTKHPPCDLAVVNVGTILLVPHRQLHHVQPRRVGLFGVLVRLAPPARLAERPRQDHVRPSDRGQMHRTYIVREGQRGGQEQEGDVVVVAVGVVQRVYLGLGHVHHHPGLRQVAHSGFDRVSALRLEAVSGGDGELGGEDGGAADVRALVAEAQLVGVLCDRDRDAPHDPGADDPRRLNHNFTVVQKGSDTFDICQTKMSNYFDTDFVKAINETREFSKHSDFDCALDVTKHKN